MGIAASSSARERINSVTATSPCPPVSCRMLPRLWAGSGPGKDGYA
jgi:hypothetical protein